MKTAPVGARKTDPLTNPEAARKILTAQSRALAPKPS